MAYIRRISDDRIFEVFGTDYVTNPQGSSTLFFVHAARWRWVDASEYEPLEELVPDDFDLEDDEEDDEKEDKL